MIDNEQKICTQGKLGILKYSNLLGNVNENTSPMSVIYVQEKLTSLGYVLFALQCAVLCQK